MPSNFTSKRSLGFLSSDIKNLHFGSVSLTNLVCTPEPPRHINLVPIALFTVNFSHLHYNVIQHGCKAISG